VINLESVSPIANSGVEPSPSKLSSEIIKKTSESLQPILASGNTSLIKKDSKEGSRFSINVSNNTESEGGLPSYFDPLIQDEEE